MNLDKVLALIPARGGSKGVPRKNIRECGGKPLIAWSIEAAQEAGLQPWVSTEDEAIANAAIDYGALLIQRPMELARDRTPTVRVVNHAVKQGDWDWVLLLQPTNPLRTAKDIQRAIALAYEFSFCVISVTQRNEYAPAFAKRIEHIRDPAALKDYDGEHLSRWEGRRQDRAPCYFRDGAIYLVHVFPQLFQQDKLWTVPATPLVLPQENSVGIDTEVDFRLADMLLRERVPA